MSTLIVTREDPRRISGDDILRMHEVMQDIWAESVGEFIQCDTCRHVYSKKDIYGHLAASEYEKTVRELMGDFEVDMSCRHCGGTVRFMYGYENKYVIRERLHTTERCFLVLARDKDGEIVGFEDAYIDELERIYKREYAYHYHRVGLSEIRARIRGALGECPERFLSLSDIGLLPRYRTIQNIHKVLSTITLLMAKEYDRFPGITEMDRRNNLFSLSAGLGGRALGIMKDPTLASLMTNLGSGYQSELVVYKNVTSIYRRAFSGTPRDLIGYMRKGNASENIGTIS